MSDTDKNIFEETAKIKKHNNSIFPFYGVGETCLGEQLNEEQEKFRNAFDESLLERMQPVHDELHNVMYAFLSCLNAPEDTIKNFITPLPKNPNLPMLFNLEYKLNNDHYPFIDQFFNNTKEINNCNVPINGMGFKVTTKEYDYDTANSKEIKKNKNFQNIIKQKYVNINVNSDIEYNIFRLEIQMSNKVENMFKERAQVYYNVRTFINEYFNLYESNIFGKLNTINDIFNKKKSPEPTFYYITDIKDYNYFIPDSDKECSAINSKHMIDSCYTIKPNNEIFKRLLDGTKTKPANNFLSDSNDIFGSRVISKLLKTISFGACSPNQRGCNKQNKDNSYKCLNQLHFKDARYNLLLAFRTCKTYKKTELISISAYTPSYDIIRTDKEKYTASYDIITNDEQVEYITPYENKFVYTFDKKSKSESESKTITFHNNLSRYEVVCQTNVAEPVEYHLATESLDEISSVNDENFGFDPSLIDENTAPPNIEQPNVENFEGFLEDNDNVVPSTEENFEGFVEEEEEKNGGTRKRKHFRRGTHFSKKHFSKKCRKTLLRKCKKTLKRKDNKTHFRRGTSSKGHKTALFKKGHKTTKRKYKKTLRRKHVRHGTSSTV